MDWNRQSDQPRTRYEPDEGNTFSEDAYVDASAHTGQPRQSHNAPDHASYDQATVVDPVFQERGRMRRERQGSGFSTQRLNAMAQPGGARSNLPLLIAIGVFALLLILALFWLLGGGDDGGDPITGGPSPSPATTASPSPSPAASPRPATGTSPTPAASPSPAAGTSPSPAASPSPAGSPAAATEARVVSGTGTAGLLLREEASTSATVIATLPEGTRLEPTGDVTNDGTRDWIRVRAPQGEGWVAADFTQPAP